MSVAAKLRASFAASKNHFAKTGSPTLARPTRGLYNNGFNPFSFEK